MRKALAVLLSGFALLLLLYTCVFPLRQESSEGPQEASEEREADTTLAEQEELSVAPGSVVLDSPDEDPQTGSSGRVDRSTAPPEQRKKATGLPSSMSRREGDVRLSPLPPIPVEEPRMIGEIGPGPEVPSVLPVLSGSAQEGDERPGRLRISIPDQMTFTATTMRGHPTSTINTPTAYGPGWKHVYAGVGYQNRIRYDDWRDGVATVGAGFGHPERSLGLDVRLNILDTYTDFAEDRSLSLKLHRRLPYRSSVAIGYENIWHTDGTDGGSSRYAVVSKVFLLREHPTEALGSMVVNLGVGTDRFLPEQRFVRGKEGLNAFGSIALRMHPRLNAVANWTGQDLALGASIVPLKTWPVVITPALVDVTGRAGDGARFSVSVSFDYDFGT